MRNITGEGPTSGMSGEEPSPDKFVAEHGSRLVHAAQSFLGAAPILAEASGHNTPKFGRASQIAAQPGHARLTPPQVCQPARATDGSSDQAPDDPTTRMRDRAPTRPTGRPSARATATDHAYTWSNPPRIWLDPLQPGRRTLANHALRFVDPAVIFVDTGPSLAESSVVEPARVSALMRCTVRAHFLHP